jgi:hypothetical protein
MRSPVKRVTRRGVVFACVFGCACALLPALASAEVKTRVRADGTVEVYNEGPSLALSRPLQLRPVPQPSWSEWIRVHAAAKGIDARLVQALMQAESGYNPRAVSRKGAIGLMQLMPGTARELAVRDAFDPEQNIRGGIAYLRQMLDLFDGRLDLALAAYNAGPGAVQRHRGVPPYAETRQYVDRVLGLYRGGGMLVGISAAGGTARPHGLALAAAPSPLQRALASGGSRRATAASAATRRAAGVPAGAVLAATPPVAAVAPAPALAASDAGAGAPAVADAAPAAVAALAAGGG